MKFVVVDQITHKNGEKAAKRKLTKFFFLAIDQSNPPRFSYTVSNGIKPLWDETAFFQTSSFSLYILANDVDSMFIHCFSDPFVSKYFQNALIEFVQT